MRQRCGSPSSERISMCSISRFFSTTRPSPSVAVIRTPMHVSCGMRRSGGDRGGYRLCVAADEQRNVEAALAVGGAAADAPDVLDPGPRDAQLHERFVERIGEPG